MITIDSCHHLALSFDWLSAGVFPTLTDWQTNYFLLADQSYLVW